MKKVIIAIAIAIVEVVTVSIAADKIGTFKSIFFVSFDFKQTEPFYIRPVFAGKTIKGYFAGYIQVADTSTRRILE